ncbi:dolichyl-phosphate-mannose--protein mannosyltransferase [Sinosporangium siamense]|uniref:Polyprenol-phosphate-mannose--protein mannosyltransferase n=1 Tax=Sinosporangium siamense TaxID=1367973 RepID=A0A919V8R7_9ACTN|nr:phospholipid carrier-dependent glycosyltransferase [Sinosporangium siamense]GII93527.1 phospholipid carrier-dependent glycosyltransferase [Sinosporangium siamense]
MGGGALWGWFGPLIVTIFGGYLRFVRLGDPHSVMFDETFYAKDAYAFTQFGVEQKTLDTDKDPIANDRLIAGNTDIFTQCPPEDLSNCVLFIAHPPLGKWMIAAGEAIFGMTPFGWRFAAALVGTLSILILARTVRRMTRSTMLGCLAGLLLSVEALHFVASRAALLDVFLMFWVLAGFACLVVDRDRYRRRLADWRSAGGQDKLGPAPTMRRWRVAAGLCLGAACAVKWNAAFFLAAFALMSLLWDAGANRAAGLATPYKAVLSRIFPGASFALGVVPVVTYVLSWIGWFLSERGYGRNWDQALSAGPPYFVFDSLRSLWSYHAAILNFHTDLTDGHDYSSQPWTWPLLIRPVAFHYPPLQKCGDDQCAQAVLQTGTPVIWYTAIIALVATVAWYFSSRDWRAGATVLAYSAGWLPWVYYAIAEQRTMYLFYAVPMVPFMIIALTLMAGLLLGRKDPVSPRRPWAAAVIGAVALLALVNFWWLYPVLAAETIPYSEWHSRMFFDSWI